MIVRFFNTKQVLLALALVLLCQPAFAGKRVALVLANSAYQNAPVLTNPVNDGTLVATTLKEAGFDVVDSRHDLSALETRRALRDFSDSARDADIAVVYYAGHGLEVDGSNYLVPVDAKLERDSDVYDEAFSLDRILLAVEPAKRLRLVILDACRDNPFDKTMKRTMASRGIGRGLAKIEPALPNTLIAYSARAGSTAQDGDGQNSPFTLALSGHLTTPGLEIRKALGFVRDDVLKATGNRQEPFVYGSLGGDDVALVAAPAAAALPAVSASSAQGDVRRDYELALQVGNKAALNAFLTQHPDGFYANLARLQLDKFVADETRPAGEQPAAPAAEPKRVDVAVAAPAAPDKTVSERGANAGPSSAELARSVQAELRRVGCLTSETDGDWNKAAQRSLAQFNRHAGTRFDVKVASSDALDAIKLKGGRVCPLICEHGFKADGDQCVKIVCAEGSSLNNDNECEKRRVKTPVARRGGAASSDRASSAERAAPGVARPQASGQIVCDSLTCRPVRRGCHIGYHGGSPRDGSGGNVEVCN
ncbi:caspase family protein [Bradyrhizobium sp.]|uniref:caspase family protein n=1 Tax=Bradyrhizobium sp. TaxID=376 RepID=UPI001EB66636|nr:caspase family protein [Bradyrhizobium sp.]MBV9983607.1 caspase family protein [Bradyrhizobium sp.]